MGAKSEKIVEVPEDVYELTRRCEVPLAKVLDFTLCSLKACRETQDKREQKT